MSKEKKLFLGRLTYFDVVIIFLLIIAAFIAAVKFILNPKLEAKNLKPVKLTFVATDLRSEVAQSLKTGADVFISNNLAGKCIYVEKRPQVMEAVTPEGNLKTFNSFIKNEARITVKANVELTEMGYFLSDVNLTIGSQYPVKVGSVSLQATLISIKEER